MNNKSSQSPVYVPSGMPQLEHEGRNTSFFEFWPLWVMYMPVAVQWLLLAIRYRSLTLPLIANPVIKLSGMVGAAKSSLFDSAGENARQWILPWRVYRVSGHSVDTQKTTVLASLEEAGLHLPIVAKPDIGCRGAGVKLLQNETQLAQYLEGFPIGGVIQFQRLSAWEAEAGVFYVRYPGEERGKITSLTLKYTPFVLGDGKSTLEELIGRDARAATVSHLYADRHRENWQRVIPEGEPYRLVFSASHCRGAIFRDGAQYIDERLAVTLDRIFDDIPGFHYGRLDIKFRDLDALMAGEEFEIIEINGASSESIHIWDRNASLGEAFTTLLQQYRTLFKLGDANRRRGHKAPGIRALWQAWQHENKLVKHYPPND